MGGFRRVIPIIASSVEAPEPVGVVLPVGADDQLSRSDTLAVLEAKHVIDTEDGERFFVSNSGIRAGSALDIAALACGETVDPDRIYFRCVPRMVSAGRWNWLGSRFIIGSVVRHPAAVHLDFLVVE